MILLVFLLSVGLVVGSFLNLVIDRTPSNLSILKPGSCCDQCRHPLSPIDLIPVVGFLYLKGRCCYCQHPISGRMPVVELLTGLVFVLLIMLKPSSLPLPLALFSASLLIGIGFSDLINGLVPDTLVFPGILGLGFWAVISGEWLRLGLGLSLVIFFGLIYLFTGRKGLGLGDVKLVGLLGLILDPFLGILSINLSLIAGGLIALILVITGRKKLGETLPLGSFLALGMLIWLIFGERFDEIWF